MKSANITKADPIMTQRRNGPILILQSLSHWSCPLRPHPDLYQSWLPVINHENPLPEHARMVLDSHCVVTPSRPLSSSTGGTVLGFDRIRIFPSESMVLNPSARACMYSFEPISTRRYQSVWFSHELCA